MIRVFLVDDHQVVRSGLRLLLAAQPDLDVVGEAGNGLELLAQLPTTPTDVVLLDVNMPGLDGPGTARQLQAQYPEVAVLALSMLDREAYIFQMLDAGARGYILKSTGSEEIITGIRAVAAGGQYLCTATGLAALHKLRESPDELAAPASQAASRSAKNKCSSSFPKASPRARLPRSSSPASAPSKPTAKTCSKKLSPRTPPPSSSWP